MNKEFELIMVSLNLSREDGLRFCSHLRSNEKTRNVPIVMVANDEDMPRVAQGLDMGVQDYIMRPVDRNELLARCRAQLRRRRYQELLRSNYEQSLNMALIDPLTSLYNRRYLGVHLEKLLQKNMASRKCLAVLMFDIDHFKSINDNYGHGVGDAVLKIFAERISNGLRPIDMVARLGGEEFCIVLPMVNLHQGKILAEKIRHSVETSSFKTNQDKVDVKISIGIAQQRGNESLQSWMKRADEALYEAKENGRNQVVLSE